MSCYVRNTFVFIEDFMGKSSTVHINGQKVYPHRRLSEGFVFTYPNLKQALTEIVHS